MWLWTRFIRWMNSDEESDTDEVALPMDECGSSHEVYQHSTSSDHRSMSRDTSSSLTDPLRGSTCTRHALIHWYRLRSIAEELGSCRAGPLGHPLVGSLLTFGSSRDVEAAQQVGKSMMMMKSVDRRMPRERPTYIAREPRKTYSLGSASALLADWPVRGEDLIKTIALKKWKFFSVQITHQLKKLWSCGGAASRCTHSARRGEQVLTTRQCTSDKYSRVQFHKHCTTWATCCTRVVWSPNVSGKYP